MSSAMDSHLASSLTPCLLLGPQIVLLWIHMQRPSRSLSCSYTVLKVSSALDTCSVLFTPILLPVLRLSSVVDHIQCPSHSWHFSSCRVLRETSAIDSHTMSSLLPILLLLPDSHIVLLCPPQTLSSFRFLGVSCAVDSHAVSFLIPCPPARSSVSSAVDSYTVLSSVPLLLPLLGHQSILCYGITCSVSLIPHLHSGSSERPLLQAHK